MKLLSVLFVIAMLILPGVITYRLRNKKSKYILLVLVILGIIRNLIMVLNYNYHYYETGSLYGDIFSNSLLILLSSMAYSFLILKLVYFIIEFIIIGIILVVNSDNNNLEINNKEIKKSGVNTKKNVTKQTAVKKKISEHNIKK